MKNKKIFSWVMYDWANSAYATIVLAGFYPIIFAENFALLFSDVERTLVLGISNSSASLLLIILAPLIGLLSDRKQDKKNFLIFFALISISSTLLLSFVGENSWMLASLLFSISLFGFMLSNVFYDSMLVNFEGSDKNYDSISSYGYAIGYLGGGIAFVLSLLFLFYFDDKTMTLIAEKKIVFIFTALWWLIFMIPLILYWKNDDGNISSDKINLLDTYRYVKNDKRLLYFLFAYWIYIDGVDTIIRMAVNYGMTIGFTSSDLLIALLVTQFVSFPGTLLINKLASYYTIDISIKICLFIYIIITFISFNLTSIYEFYLIAILIGLVQGGIQALSRSYYARLIPRNRSSELYGVYNMLGKFAALIGPLVVGLVSYMFDSTRIGILSLSLFFIFGIYLFNKQSRIKVTNN
ncbi:MAG: MFS transporter [Gammaproteobacteria bacterium]|nr:MFS transporter [Gammaproteobacteria bacterium]